MRQLTEDLKTAGRALGFDLVGVAEAAPAYGVERLRAWLDAGRQGAMAFMGRTASLRGDPRHLLPGCRSVVAVAVSYRSALPASTSHPDDDRVWVSRYAWGRDYHRLLKGRLVELGRWLGNRVPGCRWRTTVDTAPILEREWAARAGLGWIGKSTSLLNRRLGSELFLGTLLTDQQLLPDDPVPVHCGRCTACLDACPSQALVAPGQLDARRCVAYLTVEHPGEVPGELRRAVGAMIAGCDVCQEVCPWTRRAPADIHPDLQPTPHRYRPRLADLERLAEDEYRSWRRGSPLNRIPYVRFRRNLALARENMTGRYGSQP